MDVSVDVSDSVFCVVMVNSFVRVVAVSNCCLRVLCLFSLRSFMFRGKSEHVSEPVQ